jgi:hypothetical protein
MISTEMCWGVDLRVLLYDACASYTLKVSLNGQSCIRALATNR